ncbi:MAG: tRNA 2-selenouridine(34) synthase MnmH [Betaproteobacteria bacterium]
MSNARPPRIRDIAPSDALTGFDTVIDVRSEDEYAGDHIPGAISCPVLNNAERAEVGTLYKQVSPFDAKKIGAALVAANIGRHLRAHFLDKPREWKPLVYCWRGGGRSGAMAHVLAEVGWKVGRVSGGYKAYRRTVIDELETLPKGFDWRVICGMTGTGKSRLLRAMAEQGAQVLDLEALAAHRGSVLGNLPDEPQPSQKLFESRIWQALKTLSPGRPVFVESESKKVGQLRVPPALIAAMWQSRCVVIEAQIPVRVDLLMDEYTHFVGDAAALNVQLDCLRPLHGGEAIDAWQSLARAGHWRELTEALLVGHYDPAYTRAIDSHYPHLGEAPRFRLGGCGEAAVSALAADILRQD